MSFIFNYRTSDSPLVEFIWHTHTNTTGDFISTANHHWEMVITQYQGKNTLTVRGPETQASRASVLNGAEILGIVFKPGAFMPHLPPGAVLNRNDVHLPEVAQRAFWLNGYLWEFPTFNNADTFVQRLIRQDMLIFDPLVEVVLQGRKPDISERSIQRRILQATGITHKTILQIQRAQQAVTWLQQGKSILDTTYELGYFDQAHLTKSLRRFAGQTPTQILKLPPPE